MDEMRRGMYHGGLISGIRFLIEEDENREIDIERKTYAMNGCWGREEVENSEYDRSTRTEDDTRMELIVVKMLRGRRYLVQDVHCGG